MHSINTIGYHVGYRLLCAHVLIVLYSVYYSMSHWCFITQPLCALLTTLGYHVGYRLLCVHAFIVLHMSSLHSTCGLCGTVQCTVYLVPMMSSLHCTCGLCGTVQCSVYLVSMMTCLHCACGLCGTGGADWYYATRTQGDIEQASCGQGCKEKKTK